VFDIDRNPLGIDETRVSDEFVSEPRILEYKFSVDGLVEEFEKEEKNERDIKLVIAWEMGTTWASRYVVTPLLHLDNVHQRLFHGATHLVRNSLTGELVFPAIILRELIDYLNDLSGVQQYQQDTYSG
jgi:succinate dehydrogenase/fumarate reductase flavoprotein subunit